MGIKLIGDVPIYVSYDSCDVWANKELFQLDEDLNPTGVAGVPPDYFCEEGQLWGNPLYDWNRMAEDGYKWWCDRMSHMFSMFDCVRIDHFRGIESYWNVPGDAKSAKEGRWIKGPGKAFVDRMNTIRGDKMIIAEDLGDITPEVNELVEYSGFPGMRVVQFGFIGDSDSTHLPHNYINNSIAYTGTHDNNTLLGFVWEAEEDDRKRLLDYCGFQGEDWDKCYPAVLRAMFASHAGLLMLPVQDLLLYGSDTRLNTPGKSQGNWSYRITKRQLGEVNTSRYREWNRLYARLGK